MSLPLPISLIFLCEVKTVSRNPSRLDSGLERDRDGRSHRHRFRGFESLSQMNGHSPLLYRYGFEQPSYFCFKPPIERYTRKVCLTGANTPVDPVVSFTSTHSFTLENFISPSGTHSDPLSESVDSVWDLVSHPVSGQDSYFSWYRVLIPSFLPENVW